MEKEEIEVGFKIGVPNDIDTSMFNTLVLLMLRLSAQRVIHNEIEIKSRNKIVKAMINILETMEIEEID